MVIATAVRKYKNLLQRPPHTRGGYLAWVGARPGRQCTASVQWALVAVACDTPFPGVFWLRLTFFVTQGSEGQ